MLSNKKAFIAGLLVSPILCLGLLGGLGAAQSTTDPLASYLQPDNSDQASPKTPNPIPAPICQTKTIDIVAHEDDDILFMNPDLARGLNQGGCVQTIYMTAGDDGQNSTYWMQREHGAEAAYSSMLREPNDWQQISLKVDGQWSVNVATLRQAPTVSLVFVRLPDGDLFGQGFAVNNFASLQKLETGEIASLQTVDGQTSYKFEDLKSLLTSLIDQYQPDLIRTQADDYPDHSDHIAVSRLVSQVHAGSSIPLSFYNGYTIGAMPMNVSTEDLSQKEAAFMEYAKYDNAVCTTLDQCYNASTYGLYFTRQYSSQ